MYTYRDMYRVCRNGCLPKTGSALDVAKFQFEVRVLVKLNSSFDVMVRAFMNIIFEQIC